MKRLSETELVYPVDVAVRRDLQAPALKISGNGAYLGLDQTTAAELIPLLEHFVRTGELPE